VYLATESCQAGNGGIACVARLIARVLSEEAAAGRLTAGGMILSDHGRAEDCPLPLATARKSRAKFVAAVNLALPTHSHFVFDCLGMARAHQWLPWPRRPSLAYVHGIEAWAGTCHPRQVAAASRMDQLVSNSQFTREQAAELDSRFARADVCWLATEAEDPPPAAPTASGPPRVTIVGRIVADRYKGHDELLRAWPAVVAVVPDAVLTVAGTGPALPYFRKLAAVLGLGEGQVEFRGFVPEDQMAALWAETVVFAMPSRGEGFGLVYIEAMRYSVPVIGSVHDAAPEVNLDGETGYNVDLARPDELIDRLLYLLRNRDAAAALGANGRRRWSKEFTFSGFRRRFVPLLERFLQL